MIQFFNALLANSVGTVLPLELLNVVWKENSADLTVRRGGEEFFVVVAAENKEVDAVLTNGADYTAGPYGDGDEVETGQFVVYKGTETNLTVTGLKRLTRYGIKIYEARTVDGQLVYS